MTVNAMQKFLENENNKEVVVKITELLNGQSYDSALKTLQVVALYVKKNSFVDTFYVNRDFKGD